MLEKIEKASEVFPHAKYRDYFSDVVTIFHTPDHTAYTVEEKLRILENIEDIIDDLEEEFAPRLAIDAALAYIKCGGDRK